MEKMIILNEWIMNVNKKCHPLFYSDVSVIFDLGHIETEVIIKR